MNRLLEIELLQEILAQRIEALQNRVARELAIRLLDVAVAGVAQGHAAQRQLVAEGRIQNYLRMLWGKKVLEWSPSPREALARLIHLNNKYALDGRDPNSYSGISWCLGRFDRPWGPKRPVFGTVRFMSTVNARKKLELEHYLERFAPRGAPDLFGEVSKPRRTRPGKPGR